MPTKSAKASWDSPCAVRWLFRFRANTLRKDMRHNAGDVDYISTEYTLHNGKWPRYDTDNC